MLNKKSISHEYLLSIQFTLNARDYRTIERKK